jgi:hypothetical protein
VPLKWVLAAAAGDALAATTATASPAARDATRTRYLEAFIPTSPS